MLTRVITYTSMTCVGLGSNVFVSILRCFELGKDALPGACRFWWYLTTQGCLITWALLDAISAWNLHPDLDYGLVPGFKILLASFLLFVTFLFDWGLWIYHTFLLATSRTTNEHIFRRNGPVAYLQHVPRKVSAFDQGLLHNMYNICCVKDPGGYKLPPHNQLLQSAQVETLWDNRYYSCCR